MGLGLYYAAFWELSTMRQIGMGVGPIPWTAVAEYADRCDLDEEQRAALHHHLAAMDAEYLTWRTKDGR